MDTMPRRSGVSGSSAGTAGTAAKVRDSVLGRGGVGPVRRRPPSFESRALPVMALAAIALGSLGLESMRPEPTLPMVSARIEEIGPTTQLPLEINAQVEKWMRRFMTSQKGMFQTFLGREAIYADLIQGKLRERGMPEDLLYLAMIESGYSPRATSKKSAVGIWQFMEPTAAQYGLRVDKWVDERRDPVKATDAALDYLSMLHRRYDSWYLAAAAYNAGPTRVDRALRSHVDETAGEQDIYWEIIDHLPRETREYVPKLLAATTLAKQAERYGFAVKHAAPYVFDRVWVPGETSLATVAKTLGLTPTRLRELNPHLIQGATPPGSSYALRVPRGSSDRVIAAMGGKPLTEIAQ